MKASELKRFLEHVPASAEILLREGEAITPIIHANLHAADMQPVVDNGIPRTQWSVEGGRKRAVVLEKAT